LEEKERNELKHLLYVGMTRSRDYLTTLSRESTAKKALPPVLEWIRNAGISSGDTCNESNELWNYEELLPAYEDITDLEEAELEGDSMYQKKILPVGKLPTEGKYLSPSKLPIVQIEPENLEITARFERQIMVHETDHLMMDRIGTCIHNIFAVYDAQAPHEENVVRATQIRDGYGLQGALPMVEQVIGSIELLYQHLEQKYGKAESIKHEVPFIRPVDGQVMKGEMDLVWYLDKNTCVLIDFKNYPGKEEFIMNPDNDHYVGVYASQLLAYRSVLEESGCKVLDTLVYYSVIGRIVKMLV
jgi:ATP-dependent exoDNAse (exonuclease V) beta subunit